jgi:hypothetical protein
LHWNGTSWSQVASPNPAGANENDLFGVTAVSSTNVWAVGRYVTATGVTRTLVLHWNGFSWKRVASPDPETSADSVNELMAVHALSPGNIWAVGDFSDGGGGPFRDLIEHWNGTAWKHVASPAPEGSGANAFLRGVTAVSSANAWAVGFYGSTQALILHWNGRSWS